MFTSLHRSSTVDEYAFYVQCTGQIEHGRFGPMDNMYCRYSFSFGHDWVISSVNIMIGEICKDNADTAICFMATA